MSKKHHIVDFNTLPGVACPCGTARRAFADVPDYPATIHQTEITQDAVTHYHLRQTEVYYVLDCDPGARLQLDDEEISLNAGLCILIPPGVRHRGIGRIRILNIVLPKFDLADEHFD